MKRVLAACAMAVAGLTVVPGCEMSRDEMRPDMSRIQTANGLQARDLQEMTQTLAPTLLSIPEIVNNPNRITVVCKGGENRLEGEPTKDVSIFAAKMAGLLSTSAARDRIAFVAERATLDAMRAQELGNNDPMESASRYPNLQADPRIRPQFFLYVTASSMRNEVTTYYLCQFKLVSFDTGQIVWQGDWDTVARRITRR
jgi:hypothetical protein